MNFINKIKSYLVNDWKAAHTWLSVQIAALIVFLPMLTTYMPELQAYLPANVYSWLGGLIILARIIKQKRDANVNKTGT